MIQDECTIVGGPKDQGVFRSQRDDFIQGKFIVINKDAVLKKGPIVAGKLLNFVASASFRMVA